MFGVIIEKGPQNWQVLQQKDGFATVPLSGCVMLDEETLSYSDGCVIVRAIDEETNLRIGQPAKVKPEDGKWECTLTLPAGGPYRIETYYRFFNVREKRGDRIFHIGVGDVYVITGQSNAVGVGKDMVTDEEDPNVRMFRLSGSWDIAAHPLHDSTNTLFPLSQEQTQTGHSPWLAFGKYLSKTLGYPIGLIPGTKGGIPLSYWDRAEDGAFFDNMLEIVKASGSEVKGIIWYQGCNDCYSDQLRATYFERFKRVCKDFEDSFFTEIPILTVQLNKSTCTKDKDVVQDGRNFAEVREAQRRAMHEISNVHMVPTIDLPVCDGIHNACISNMAVGLRVAAVAMKYVYGKDVLCDAPDVERAVLEDGCNVRLYIAHVVDALFSDFNRTEDLLFTVTDEQGRMELADYECEGGNTVLLKFSRPIVGKAAVSCDKYNETGLMPYDLYTYLPLIPFMNVPVEY